MTEEEIQKLGALIREKKEQFKKIQDTSVEQMWKEDLFQFLEFLDKIEGQEKLVKQKADQKYVKKYEEIVDKKVKKQKKPKDPKNDDKKSIEKKEKIKQKSIKPEAVIPSTTKLQELQQKP